MTRSISLCVLMMFASLDVFGQTRQPREVVDAYRVCRQFQELMAENFDFDRAFEATFTKNARRRREIAIYEGEFGDLDFTRVDSATLIDAFKSRMQIFYLLLLLVDPENKGQAERFFPAAIEEIIDRKPPQTTRRFSAYALQLKRDAASLRAHMDQLEKMYPERFRRFKEEELFKKLEPPDHIVRPLTAYSRGRVLRLDEPYYQIGEYAVIREGRQMKIVGIRFFLRLF